MRLQLCCTKLLAEMISFTSRQKYYCIKIGSCKQLTPGGPIPHNLARPLMVRQPYSVAVLSTGGRLHPLVPEEREAW